MELAVPAAWPETISHGCHAAATQQVAANQERIRARGAELGFVFDMARRRHVYNTFDAHRLLHWAEDAGHLLDLKRALLRAYFTDGRNVADEELKNWAMPH